MGIKHKTRVSGTDISQSAIYGEDHEIEDGTITSAMIVDNTVISTDLAAGIAEIPASFLVYKSGSTYYARNGSTGAILTSGADASVVIQAALNALTSGRTWKEKVVLKGDFTVSSIALPSYTTLEILGSLKVLTPNTNIIDMSEVNDVDIIGGTFDLNSVGWAGIAATGTDTKSLENILIQGSKFKNPSSVW